MIIFITGLDKDVTNEDYDEHVQVILEHSIHQVHKAGSEVYLRKVTGTLKIGTLYEKTLGLMNPLSKMSFKFSFNSLSLVGAIIYGRIEMGWVSGRRSISKSISLSEETPEKSSGNTSGNYLTTEIDSRFGVSELESLTQTR
ncbi:hypothetical protein CQW23_01888 [Capsicum baccatum]|uniref:Uncharacterized protein n=1 Tax=Capsicum baccatum TaxID=33114 RepID=A0A2G2XPV9_CAPBA|nr:hypothetical protein CQW23_01888 [Capsicum baccatum]